MSTRIESARLRLRDVEDRDVTPRYAEWLNDPEVSQFLETRFEHHTEEAILEYVRVTRDAADALEERVPRVVLAPGDASSSR